MVIDARALKLLLAASALLLGQGCATVTRGTTVAWTVETDPAGAEVTLSSGETCRTPCTLKKRRKDPFEVTLAKPGYAPVRTQVLSTVSGAGAAGMAGNVLVGGIIGIGVDAATGATKDLKPNPLVVRLEPVSAGASADPAQGAATGTGFEADARSGSAAPPPDVD